MKKAAPSKRQPCGFQMRSQEVPGHVHDCVGHTSPDDELHLCSSCGRYWWTAAWSKEEIEEMR